MWLLLVACSPDSTAAPAAPSLPVHLVEVARVPQPTAIAHPPGAGAVLYVTEQAGRIWKVEGGKAAMVGDLSARLVAGGERGLLGLAFHPAWPTDPRVFVNYTFQAGEQLRTRIASFSLRDGQLDPASEVEILTFDQPYQNHNSGALAFGADGYLYAAVGDGGAGGDPKGTGQRLDDLLGSILRVDVSVAPYRVPPDNPFVATAGARPEIWAYGVRNPWGMSFDGDQLWFADVGQNTWEEVNRGKAGANYGWNVWEASHCYEAMTCDATGMTMPVAEYHHDVGQSVTGGVVYRGPSIPPLDGRYVYADYGSGLLFAVPTNGGPAVTLGKTGRHPTAIGVDGDGRLYLGDYGGVILRVDP